MDEMNENLLATHLKERPVQLEEAKKEGVKIIGYFPGNYVPEEIIYASGAVPICLIHGGDPRPADAGLSLVPHVLCPFSRTQLGERLLGENPYYRLMDMLVAPITCQHLKKVAEIWEYNRDLEMFKLGIPQQYSYDFEVDYYSKRLKALRDRLQAFTGNQIAEKKLIESIDLYNRMRAVLRKISYLRRSTDSSVTSLDFVKLNHASFYADPVFMVDYLESYYNELKKRQSGSEIRKPRILLIGPNMGYGDYTVLELVEAAGGEIVIEELCEGIRYYWHDIESNGSPFQSLTKGYLTERIPCGFMRYSSRKRLDFTLKLIDDFDVSGVIWYELLYCETYDSESYYFSSEMRKRDIPMLILESSYSTADTGQIKTRIDAFVEIVKGVM
jgi:benzoyl-CoA reductase/2-hydroxyglutaryl-CoA dehydratase subunit BcrC/BadD/HgdB